MKRLIGMCFPTNTCNLNCEYCFVHKETNKMEWINYSLEEIDRAFSTKRLGGKCFINISSNGEPMMNEKILKVIHQLAKQGHYIMVLTNGTMSERFDEILSYDTDILEQIFFKFSFHYRELVRMNILDTFFINVNKIKYSPASFSVELMADDNLLDFVDEIKTECMNNLGALPHVSIPRDERQYTLGVISKYSNRRFFETWDAQEFKSDFFDFKTKTFGKHVDWFCYAGMRSIWVDMGTGVMRQCYHTPDIQNIFDFSKEIEWLPVGNQCCEAHCYVSHIFMPLGIVDPPEGVKNGSYYLMRSRCGNDGIEWVKAEMKKAFEEGVAKDELSCIEKDNANIKNKALVQNKPNRDKIINRIFEVWLENKIQSKGVKQFLELNQYKKIAIYGLGDLGKMLIKELETEGINIAYVIDRNADRLKKEITQTKLITPIDMFDQVDAIIVTSIMDFFKIKELCEKKCNYHIVSIEEVIYGVQKL